jgi:hypothetical protein
MLTGIPPCRGSDRGGLRVTVEGFLFDVLEGFLRGFDVLGFSMFYILCFWGFGVFFKGF